MRRLIPLALVALVLAPGTWIRTPVMDRNYYAPVTFMALPIERNRLGAFRIEHAWQLDSANDLFGGYSAAVSVGQERLLLGSDFQNVLMLDMAQNPPEILLLRQFMTDAMEDKRDRDLESLTRDPATGTIWAGYEFSNTIKRLSPDLTLTGTANPQAMQEWANNSGPEAMVRLSDGRFIVLAEQSAGREGHHSGLMFREDPILSPDGQPFVFVPPVGFTPVDMIELPDGSALILVRTVDWGFPPRFRAALVQADPARIAPGGEWRGRVVAWLDDSELTDNFEGLAVIESPSGQRRLFVVSDDNQSSFQRTLLLELSSEKLLPDRP